MRISVRYIIYIAYLGVQYEIYPLSFSFDLRWQSGIYLNNALQIVSITIIILIYNDRVMCSTFSSFYYPKITLYTNKPIYFV